jgi:hypothetical protein
MNQEHDIHRQVWEQIPWLLAAGERGPEAEAVLAHCAACARCGEELAFQRRLQQAMQLPPSGAVDAEAGLQGLLQRVQGEAVAPPGSRPGRPGGGWTRWLVAAVLVQSVGLAVMSALLLRADALEPAYQTLSDAPAGQVAVRLVVDAQMPVAQLQALVQASGLQIVEARAEAGVFGLAPAGGVAVAPEALERLRAAGGVRLVSLMPAGPPPRP